MSDVSEFVKTVKKAAVEAVEALKPVSLYFGEVISASPLQINVEQKMLLNTAQLVLSERVTQHRTVMQGAAGREEIVVCSALAEGDKVILARQQEGQKFFVLDRIGGMG